MLQLRDRLAAAAAWCRAGRRDYQQAHLRRLAPAYRARRRLVEKVWLGAAAVLALNPVLPLAIIVGMFTSFLSYAILDETPLE